jgi:hypothetical protein
MPHEGSFRTVTPDQMPACVCTAHPHGDDRKKYMIVAEETPDMVVFCCKRCSEITKTAVIQVRTMGNTRARAVWQEAEKRKRMDPKLLKMLMARKRPRVRYHREEESA